MAKSRLTGTARAGEGRPIEPLRGSAAGNSRHDSLAPQRNSSAESADYVTPPIGAPEAAGTRCANRDDTTARRAPDEARPASGSYPDPSAMHDLRQPIQDNRLGDPRQHRLPPMRQIAQPRGPIDRRARVVGLATQLDLPGVHPDPDPDRGQRAPVCRGNQRKPAASDARANAATKLSPSPCSSGRTPS